MHWPYIAIAVQWLDRAIQQILKTEYTVLEKCNHNFLLSYPLNNG